MPKVKEIESPKPDKKGKVIIRIFLQDEKSGQPFTALAGNRRKDLVVEDSTVGEVCEILHDALTSWTSDA